MARLFIYAFNIIGTTMAGPSIRCWEFAKALGRSHEVFLIAPQETEARGENFTILVKNDATYQKLFPTVDVILTQVLSFSLALKAKQQGIKIILDAYTPTPLEQFEQFKSFTLADRQRLHGAAINNLRLGFQMADHIICASEKQRDLWLGFLLGQELFDPVDYIHDNSLRHLIDVVPFGLSSQSPLKNGPGLREQYHFQPSDRLVVWGGGIWDWFDPLSLIRAMKLLQDSHPEIKLIFMGVKNPDPLVKEMAMTQQAITLAEQLNLKDQTVFFNHGWIPYQERHNFLLDASVGVSTHFDHLETRYAFRTRMLDYLWAQLPILATQGDTFAELIEKNQLGQVVPYQDEEAIKQALIKLTTNTTDYQGMKERLGLIAHQFKWEVVVQPLDRAITFLSAQSKHSLSIQDVKKLVSYATRQVKEKGLRHTLNIIKQKIKK
jgi:glycosyltransferase involved in cell wall biosynthesis